MADNFKTLEGLLLNAVELQQLTDWDDRVIEDYLELTRNIIKLAKASDTNEDALAAHEADFGNPHRVTFTQAVAQDPATDITAAEAEQLSDGSNADSLHKHLLITNQAGSNKADVTGGLFQVTLGSVLRFVVSGVGNLIASAYPQDTRDDGTVSDEKVLTTDNSGNVLLRRVIPYSESYSDAVGGVSDVNALTLYYTFNFTAPEAGDYILEFCWLWSYASTNQNFLCDIVLDGVDTLLSQVQEPKDSGGGGINLPNLNAPPATLATNSDQRLPASCFCKRTLTAGAHSVTISIGGSAGNNEAAIYQSSGRVTRDA